VLPSTAPVDPNGGDALVAKTRICFVGGGSYNWMPKLLQDVALTRDLAGTVVLHDINPAALEDIQRYGRKVMAAAEADVAVEATTDLREGLRGADFVVVTITTGGLETMALDLDIPRKYGIYQSVGDTVGPGGLSRALRNVPVMLEIARAMERECPDAWMLNLTNPLTVLTRVVTKETPIKAMGLCHELFGVRGGLMRMFGAAVEDFEMRVAGVNHLIWLLDLKIGGRDGFAMVREYTAGGRAVPTRPSRGAWSEPFEDHWRLKLALFEAYGYLPAAGDRHLAEFFPYFLTEATHCGADFGVQLTTIEHRRQQVAMARDKVHAAIGGELPPLERSQEASADIISAVANGRSVRTIVNLPNVGQIDNLPRAAVVETLAEIGAAGAQPLGVGELPPGVLGTVQPHVTNQEMIVEAALKGDRQLALQALLNDPLTRDFCAAPRMLDELLAAHAAYLPQF
jgi:alpha-galactosidase/6-phospho-beta-glucosidase family protein